MLLNGVRLHGCVAKEKQKSFTEIRESTQTNPFHPARSKNSQRKLARCATRKPSFSVSKVGSSLIANCCQNMTFQRINLSKGFKNHFVQLCNSCVSEMKVNGPCRATNMSHYPYCAFRRII